MIEYNNNYNSKNNSYLIENNMLLQSYKNVELMIQKESYNVYLTSNFNILKLLSIYFTNFPPSNFRIKNHFSYCYFISNFDFKCNSN